MKVNISYKTKPTEVTARVAEIAEAFGIGVDDAIEHVILEDYDFNEDFSVCYITGVSGTGKSSLLRELQKQYNYDSFSIEEIMDRDDALIDLIGADTKEAISEIHSLKKAMDELLK